MSVAEAEEAVKLAENQAKRARQHVVAIRLLTRNGENTSNYTRKQLEKNVIKMFNADKAAKRARRTLRNTRLRAQLQSNDPTPLLIVNDPPWYNLIEEELVPSPSRAKSQRKTRRHRRRN